jgi:hypothetical protein
MWTTTLHKFNKNYPNEKQEYLIYLSVEGHLKNSNTKSDQQRREKHLQIKLTNNKSSC